MSWQRKYIGKQFKDLGRGPDNFDCWGLVSEIYRHELGIDLPHYAISPMATGIVSEKISERLNTSDWVKTEDPSEFDICIMALDYTKPTQNNHIAVYLGSGAAIHTIKETGSTIINLSSPMWRSRVKGFYKWQSS